MLSKRATDKPGTWVRSDTREGVAACFNQDLTNPYVIPPDIPEGMTIEQYRKEKSTS